MGVVCSVNEGYAESPGICSEPVGDLRTVTHRLLERCTIRPFGLMGLSDLGPEPGVTPLGQGAPLNAVIVDGATYQDLVENTPFAAKGESLSLYQWLGIAHHRGSFPLEVHRFFNKDGTPERIAKYHKYGEGQHVIHVASPQFRKMDQGIHKLILTYASILWEFCEAVGPDLEEEYPDSPRLDGRDANASQKAVSSGSSVPRHLRLLPISGDGGMGSKELLPQIGRMFWTALAMAIEYLPEVLQRRLQSAVIEVCVYRNMHVKVFEDALREKWYRGGLRPREHGQLRSFDGNMDWVRRRGQAHDRYRRLCAASLTMRAVWEQGYCLTTGSGVGLNYISRMLSGTRIRHIGDLSPDLELVEAFGSGREEEGEKSSELTVHGCIDDSATVVELATALARKGKRVAAINVSSPQCPGGETLLGECHGPEEEWCITTTLLKSLQHAYFLRRQRQESCSSESSTRNSFIDYGCVVSPFVEVFRDTSDQGYAFLSEPAILSSVVTIMLDLRTTLQVSENDVSRVLRNAVSAVIENGAEVLVCSYIGIFELLEDPIAAGSLLGKVLREMEAAGPLEEVVLVGSRLFAEAANCAVRGMAPPMAPQEAAQAASIVQGCVLANSEQSRSTTTKSWSKTARHDSSEFVSKHYTEVREIGSGSFGRVALVREISTQEERVCKTVNVRGMKKDMVKMLKKEAELLCNLDHPGIVRLYEYAEDLKLSEIIMVLEYIPGGGCDELLAQNMGVPLSEPLAVHIVAQLLVALAYCHARGVIHRDLKPENIMLTCRPIWRNPDVKVIDFGAAAGEELTGEIIGTVEYMAPEVVLGKKSGAKADIWAMAVIAFELIHGEPPFGSCDDELTAADEKIAKDSLEMVQKRIVNFTGNFDEIESHSSAPLWHKWQCRSDRFWQRTTPESLDFIQKLVSPKAADRPSAVQALEHPWLQMNRAMPNRLTGEMAFSLASYVKAPKVVQCCMVVVAAGFGLADLEDVSTIFLGADVDCDGKLSLKELRHALAEIEYASTEPKAAKQQDGPVKDLFLTGDLGITEGLGFTEFSAACLFSKQESLDRLIEDAFHALDVDRDGLVLIEDARGVFESPDLLPHLPENHGFSLEEWCACIRCCMAGTPLEQAMKSSGVPLGAAPPKPTPTIRIRRRGQRSGCC